MPDRRDQAPQGRGGSGRDEAVTVRPLGASGAAAANRTDARGGRGEYRVVSHRPPQTVVVPACAGLAELAPPADSQK